jgi:hypothetical protein
MVASHQIIFNQVNGSNTSPNRTANIEPTLTIGVQGAKGSLCHPRWIG